MNKKFLESRNLTGEFTNKSQQNKQNDFIPLRSRRAAVTRPVQTDTTMCITGQAPLSLVKVTFSPSSVNRFDSFRSLSSSSDKILTPFRRNLEKNSAKRFSKWKIKSIFCSCPSQVVYVCLLVWGSTGSFCR